MTVALDQSKPLILNSNSNTVIIGLVKDDLPTPTPSQTPPPSPSMSPTPTPSFSPSPTPSPSPSRSPTPTPTLSPSSTPSPSPSRSPTPTPTLSPSPTPSPSPSRSPTPTPSASPSPTTTPLPTGFVASGLQVKLDMTNFTSGSTTWTNQQGNGNNGVLTNGPIPVSGSIQFDGTNDYLTFTSGAIMRPSTTQGVTLQAWIYPTSQKSTGLFGKLSNLYGYDGYIFSYRSGTFSSTTNGTGVDRQLTGTNARPLVNNQWQFVTFMTVINATSGSTQGWVNTTQVLAGTHGTDSYNDANFLRVGQGYHGDNTASYQGRIGAFYFYERSLTSAEITNNFNDTKGTYGIS